MTVLTRIRFEEAIFGGPTGRFLGKRLILDDGQHVWLRTLKQEHVMRSGRLGFDALTHDLYFKRKGGYVLCRLPDGTEFQAYHTVIEEHGKRRTYGKHGEQIFLEFRYWQRDGQPSMVEVAEAVPVTREDILGNEVVEWPCPKCGRELESVEANVFDPTFGSGICGRSVTRCTRKRVVTRRNPAYDAAR